MSDVNTTGRHRFRLARTGSAMGVLLLAACAPPPPPFPDLPRLDVRTAFGSRNQCEYAVSPAIRIARVPPETARYVVKVTNLDVLYSTPWQGIVAAGPEGIAEGAIPGFPAPCPGDLQSYAYRIEVLAQTAQGTPLGYGATRTTVLPIAQTLRRERGERPNDFDTAAETDSESGVLSMTRRNFPGQGPLFMDDEQLDPRLRRR